jgi:adenylate kinase
MELTTSLWMHEIAYNLKENERFLLDGCPRRLSEAKIIQNFLQFIEELKSTSLIFIDVSRKEAFARLLHRRVCKKCEKIIPWVGEYKNLVKCDRCGGSLIERADDQGLIKLKRRFDIYSKDTVPAINYLKVQCHFIKINGEQTIENVFKDIIKAIEK